MDVSGPRRGWWAARRKRWLLGKLMRGATAARDRRGGRAQPVNQYFAFGVRPTWMFSGVSLRLLHCASSVHLTNRGDGMSTRQDAGKVVHLECCICMFSPQQISYSVIFIERKLLKTSFCLIFIEAICICTNKSSVLFWRHNRFCCIAVKISHFLLHLLTFSLYSQILSRLFVHHQK